MSLSDNSVISFVPPETLHIAIIGLGYVGLPLAVEFAKKYKAKGFDIKGSRIKELNQNHDRTQEIDNESLAAVRSSNPNSVGLLFTSDIRDISDCNIYIIAVPTPTDQHNKPDLRLLRRASEMVGSVLKQNDIVIYESTVYPGATEEYCIPVLESTSGLIFNQNFFAGFRLNALTRAIKSIRSQIL